MNMLDKEGYRANVGIVLCNDNQQVLWARRIKHDGWQFPQGGVKLDESPDDAMFRELREEIGLKRHHVEVIGRTSDWLRYDLPQSCRRNSRSRFRGQNLSDCPEFDHWQWVTYWQPLKHVVHFKRDVYQAALEELEAFLK
jgi:putative (di)nucleoside polyphosphate hydrolase